MKFKSDFITNSSSTSYIIFMNDNQVGDFVDFINKFTSAVSIDESLITSVKQLNDLLIERNCDELKYSEIEQIEEILKSKVKLYYVSVSDELGHGFMENTIYKDYILKRLGEY